MFFRYLMMGIGGVLIIDILGSIASRKLNFNYAYLSILSFLLYTYIGYLVSKSCGIELALIVNFIVGIFDATIGLFLSIRLKAKSDLTETELRDIVGIKMVVIMLVFALICTTIGYAFAQFLK